MESGKKYVDIENIDDNNNRIDRVEVFGKYNPDIRGGGGGSMTDKNRMEKLIKLSEALNEINKYNKQVISEIQGHLDRSIDDVNQYEMIENHLSKYVHL